MVQRKADDHVDRKQSLIPMNKAISTKGPFYTWSLEEKADFYNKYVYHNTGTRRGVPDERHIGTEAVKNLAYDYLCSYLDCIKDDLSDYIPDVDFWIEVNMQDFDEHEYYSVCFLTENTDSGKYENTYQLMISAYTGSLIQLLDIKQMGLLHNSEKKTELLTTEEVEKSSILL